MNKRDRLTQPDVASPARRNLYVFGVTSFFNDTASEMVYWLLPSFLVTLGAGPAQLGLIEGIAESVASAAKLLSGQLADRFRRRKPMIVAGYAVANAAKPLLALATSWVHVLFIRFSDRTAKGIRSAPRDVLLAESVDKKQLGSAFGLLQSMDTAGAIAGPLLALWIVAHLGLRGVFWAAAIPGLLSVFVVATFAKETKESKSAKDTLAPAQAGGMAARSTIVSGAPAPPKLVSIGTVSAAADKHSDVSSVSLWNGSPPHAVAESGTPGAMAPVLKRPIPNSFYYVLFAVTLFSIGNSSDMFLVLRAREIGTNQSLTPLLGLVFNVTYTLAAWPAGKLSDRVPKRLVAAAGYFVFAVTYVVFALAPSQKTVWINMAFYGLFYALSYPVLRALVVEKVAPSARGRALGIFYFVTSLATLSASVITGELWKRFGARVPFLLSAGLALCAAVLLAVYSPKDEAAVRQA